MCKDCIKVVEQMNPKYMEMLHDIREDLETILIKIGPYIRDIIDVELDNNPTGLDPVVIPDDVKAKHNKMLGIMGLAYAVGWSCVRMSTHPKECDELAIAVKQFTNSGMREAVAYEYVIDAAMH